MNAQNTRGLSMNRAIMMLTLAVGLTIVFYACKNDQQGVSQGKGAISGNVTDGATGAALSGVTVQAQRVSADVQTVVTDNQGHYEFSFDTDSTISITLTFGSKSGYFD
jgi:cytoskeletal protein RodZ